MKKDKTEEYRTNITLHLTRISGDIEHIKEKVDLTNEHLEKINGRLRTAENNITAIKTTGITLYTVLGALLAWFGISK